MDLDPQAAELAAVNLMLRAMERGQRLPLILNQNIKVGNSLISGLPAAPADADALAPHAPKLAELRRLRLAQQGAASDAVYVADLQDQINALRAEVNAALNASLDAYFDDIKDRRPFNWPVEFAEVFVDEDGRPREDGGFTVVVGNPPWGAHFSQSEKAYCRTLFQNIHIRTPESFNYFIGRMSHLVTTDSLVGTIIPSSFLTQYEFTKSREMLLRNRSILRIVNLGEGIFYKVTAPSCLMIFATQEPGTVLYQDLRKSPRLELPRLVKQHSNLVFRDQTDLLEKTNATFTFRSSKIEDLLAKIMEYPQLGDIVEEIATGVSSGLDKAYVVSQSQIEELELEDALLKKLITGGEIHRFHIERQTTKHLIYTTKDTDIHQYTQTERHLKQFYERLIKRREMKKGLLPWFSLNWPRRLKLFELPKIMIRQTADRLIACYDKDQWFALKSVILVQGEQQFRPANYHYLVALLNSTLMNYVYTHLTDEQDRVFAEVKPIILQHLPIYCIDFEDARETARHDALVALAQTMHNLNRTHQIVTAVFNECLTAREHTRRRFHDAYYAHSKYRETHLVRVGLANANARGVVTGIAIDEDEERLAVRVNVETAGETPLVSLRVENKDLRRFLLLSLRADLHTKRRKKKWSRGRLLRGALNALEVPVLVETSASANLDAIADLMAEVRRRAAERLAEELGERASELNDPLALSHIEATLAATDRQIDTLVYELYGLSPEEIAVIEGQ